MATIRQKRVAKKIANALNNGKPITREKILKSSGYSLSTSLTKQKRIIESVGVVEELENYGFTEENARKVLGNILSSPVVSEMVTPDNQIRAAQEVFKVHGSYAPEKKVIVNISTLLDELAQPDKGR